ncbi:hypothetical protein ISF_00006 [Cordyceps fumosorosea ARSEF 2679]|uniref:Uncharacterized protein n=1 Tax=Cordyceps fumosorosea (strain ARSEF 2679) TaxID=1081104 RepID=A0A168DWU4_CORFA|nr:hypothetical protein ISF_00006 [Cordyceps fumosorosea ARSEF 2679]OAA73105.1 hypothetical protein ISF_00006 [Cordyceps fumosorosea ARSEF 2679]
MALTVKQLGSPSSFLLTFEPLDTSPVALSTPSLTPTLRLLPATTTLLAVPSAARRIRSWRPAVATLPLWDDAAPTASVLRIPVPSGSPGGGSETGELTLTCIGRRRDAHAAIGITYRPPAATPSPWRRCTVSSGPGPSLMLPPPRLPTPALSFSSSSPSSNAADESPVIPLRPRRRSVRVPPRGQQDHRGVSVVLAPRGIAYRALQGYATAHLLQQAVLPLTALLHPFDDRGPIPSSASRFFLLGAGRGSSSSSKVSGKQTASALGARAWIGAHSGDVKPAAAEAVQRALDESVALLAASPGQSPARGNRTEVRALASGEELTMTSEGVWEEEDLFGDDDGGGKAGRLFGLGLDIGEDEDGRILGGALPLDWIDAVR